MNDVPSDLTWGAERKLMDKWPCGQDGKPEKAVFLTHTGNRDFEDDMLVQMLEAYEIPCMRRYPENGVLGRLYLGLSGNGVDIYVPESVLDDARALLAGDAGEELDE